MLCSTLTRRESMNTRMVLWLSHSLALLAPLGLSGAPAPSRAWLTVGNPSAAEVAAQFVMPPPENGLILWWGWDGPVTPEVITHDLDRIKAMGFSGVMIEAGKGMDAKYLSPGWFGLFRVAIEQARARNLRVWVEDEGKYPSGFVGGRFTRERPDLCMQVVVAGEQFDVAAGETLARPLAPGTICAVAYDLETGANRVLDIAAGELKWTAPAGKWQVVTTQHVFRSGPTAWAENPSGARKDNAASLCDYLNPEATRKIIEWTYEGYKQAAGDEFGRTFMGLMGDEPAFAGTPWTPAMLDEFQKRKGYDVRPYLRFVVTPSRAGPPPSGPAQPTVPAQAQGTAQSAVQTQTPGVAAPAPAVPRPQPQPPPTIQLTDEQRRAKADYWDVWSDLFGQNYFQQLAEWCAANNCEYIVHLDQDDRNVSFVRTGGDYFKNMRSVGIPGIDVIWAQIWFDHEADYPKLASSAAHLFGRPHAFTESFAAFTNPVDVPTAKWVIDYQLVRGINLIQVMFMSASSSRRGPEPAGAPGAVSGATQTPGVPPVPGALPAGAGGGGRRHQFFTDPEFLPVASYVHRAAYLLSMGRPAAQIGVYLPTTSLWLGDAAADKSNLAVAQQLLAQHRDFDWVDEQALSSVLKLEGGELKNRSGQGYRAIIVPAVSAISSAALENLRKFAAAGGCVVFMGGAPAMVVGKTFLQAERAPDLAWALVEPAEGLTPRVLAALPKPDVAFVTYDQRCAAVKCVHRRWRDADLYFFFNEGTEPQSHTVALAGTGQAWLWDAAAGRIEKIAGSANVGDTVWVTLALGGHESRFIVIGPGVPESAVAR